MALSSAARLLLNGGTSPVLQCRRTTTRGSGTSSGGGSSSLHRSCRHPNATTHAIVGHEHERGVVRCGAHVAANASSAFAEDDNERVISNASAAPSEVYVACTPLVTAVQVEHIRPLTPRVESTLGCFQLLESTQCFQAIGLKIDSEPAPPAPWWERILKRWERCSETRTPSGWNTPWQGSATGGSDWSTPYN